MNVKILDRTADAQARGKHLHTYQAYLLRLWRGGEDEPWRASLVPVGKEEGTIHFAGLAGLLTFLETQIGPNEKGKEVT